MRPREVPQAKPAFIDKNLGISCLVRPTCSKHSRCQQRVASHISICILSTCNVLDGILELVREKNSLAMANFAPEFISCKASDRADGIPVAGPVHATLERAADHILYIGNFIGFEDVGIGSDFDGLPTVPRELEDVSRFPNLIKELLKRGVSDKDASNMAEGNLLRVWKKVDEVSPGTQAGGVLPVEG